MAEVIITPATLSWRGMWGRESATELTKLGLVKRSDLKILSTRVLIGGLAEYRLFNFSTSLGWRTGVG